MPAGLPSASSPRLRRFLCIFASQRADPEMFFPDFAAQLLLLLDSCLRSCLHAFCCAMFHRTAPLRLSTCRAYAEANPKRAHGAHTPRPIQRCFASCSAFCALLPRVAPCGSGMMCSSPSSRVPCSGSACLSRVATSYAILALASLSFSLSARASTRAC
jgi:hypothetical protein